MVGQGLEGFEAMPAVGVGHIALNGQDADDGRAIADGNEHERGGRARRIAKGDASGRHLARLLPED